MDSFSIYFRSIGKNPDYMKHIKTSSGNPWILNVNGLFTVGNFLNQMKDANSNSIPYSHKKVMFILSLQRSSCL